MTAETWLPLVVIGIPTFNRAGSVARAIRSALAQDYPNVAVHVSDNASTDGTAEICQGYAADKRLSYFRHPSNVGATNNFVGVLQRAQGELFMWLADDDWLDPHYVRRCVQFFREHPGLVIAGGRAKYYRDDVFTHEGGSVNCTAKRAGVRVLQYYRQVDDNAIFYGVMRREAAGRVKLLNCLGSDWLFMAAMAYQGEVRTVEGVFCHRALGGASESLRKMTQALSLPEWQGRIPLTFSLAAYAARDIGWDNRVYRDMSAVHRRALAVLVSFWMCAIKPVQELRRRLRYREARGTQTR